MAALIFLVSAVLFISSSVNGAETTTGPYARAWGASLCASLPTKSTVVPDYPPGTKITVECPEGYAYATEYNNDDEPQVATCQSDGNFNKRLGSCQRVGATCDKPASSSRVKIIEQSAPITESPNKFSEGSFIKYACDSGYSMSGSATLTCMPDGFWAPRFPPACNTQEPDVIVVTNRCYMPAVPTNGDILSQSAPVNDGTGLSFSPNSRITYRCNQGYVMVGGAVITCNSAGNWDRRPPQCQISGYREKSTNSNDNLCRKPDSPLRGRIVYSYPEDMPPYYPLSGRVRFACDRGYQLRGSSTIECQASGQWSPAIPTCV